MPASYASDESYGDDTTTYDGMDVDGDSTLGGQDTYETPSDTTTYETPSDTTTYDGMDVGGDDSGTQETYDEPASDTTTYSW